MLFKKQKRITEKAIKERPIPFTGEMVRAILEGRKTQTRRLVKPSRGLQSEWLTMNKIHRFVKSGEMINQGWQMWHPKGGPRSPYGCIRCPYGQSGDRLWVRETWAALKCQYDYESGAFSQSNQENDLEKVETFLSEHKFPVDKPPFQITYQATDDWEPHFDDRLFHWKPSIHMFRWASRINLEMIADVRVERVQDISEEDAKAEGIAALTKDDTVTKYAVMDLGDMSSVPWSRMPTNPIEVFNEMWNSIYAKRGFGWAENPWVWVIEFRRLK